MSTRAQQAIQGGRNERFNTRMLKTFGVTSAEERGYQVCFMLQWSSWLSHTRPLPPTLEELQADLERQQRVRANVALIEARDREERAQMLRLQATPPGTYHVSQKVAGQQATSQPPSEGPQKVQAASEPPQKPETPLPKMAGSDTYEPEPWAPRARTRGE
ncbi:hypothetical protein D9615_005888 [Tricholomella constricta]|uniref:Uncharacterized protein n=1 Tax=Tricholomella constricta TaxID=117010 RepID=A0A8H5H9I2_9AGAR|nr:hypothetical protein D9615_005888 [Tricholomella constricta]